ncbi:glycosyltransferase [Cyanobium sp. Copco_Reservoir_LC18]|nr:glycosyltransferase [Cyanobium sp. Copco_Reservoir_LC18]
MAKHSGLPDDIQLVCTGEDLNRRQRLEAVAEGLRISPSVKMTGFVAAQHLDSLYAHSLAVVFPSLYEGFGMPVIEAMALGVPVACSSTTALAEVAGDAALLFDPGHPGEIATAMCRLSLEKELRATCIQKGRVQSSRYTSPGTMANSYWELFHDALKGFPAT